MSNFKSLDRDLMLKILIDILEKKIPSFVKFVDHDLKFHGLSRMDRLAICDALSDEFSETGIGDNKEPNDRGFIIERLIDVVNPSKEAGLD